MRRLEKIFLGILVLPLFAVIFGCAPQQGNGRSAADQGTLPQLTDQIIFDRINGARVYEVMPESGSGDPISWSFDRDEPKEIVVIDKQVDGTRATVVLDIKTQSSPYAKSLRVLSGQIRTEWELETGFVLRRWTIVGVENISMKYQVLPKPQDQNTNN